MSKRYDDPIEVTPIENGSVVPLAFTWRGRRYDVDRHLGSWREAGGWWDPNTTVDRELHRVLARPEGLIATGELDQDGCATPTGAVYDLCRDRVGNAWRLVRVWD